MQLRYVFIMMIRTLPISQKGMTATWEKIQERRPYTIKWDTRRKKICLKPKPISVPDTLHGSQGKNKRLRDFHCHYLCHRGWTFNPHTKIPYQSKNVGLSWWSRIPDCTELGHSKGVAPSVSLLTAQWALESLGEQRSKSLYEYVAQTTLGSSLVCSPLQYAVFRIHTRSTL